MENTPKRIHFIAIGGSAMHNLAIALHNKGYQITGSDDEIYEPAHGNLKKHALLPETTGWFPEKITKNLDAVILGMHARPDNPELNAAQELGIKIYSYPEFVFKESVDKQRIVVAGSHGKTTITAMIMHVLKHHNRVFDYLVGAAVEGFELNVKLTDEAPVIIIEGDEYLASPIHRQPKFLIYQHHIGLVSGIAWDHMNVFPTEDVYVRQFDHFADATPKAGILIFNDEDAVASVICKKERADVTDVEYVAHKAEVKDGITYLISPGGTKHQVQFFGKHNLLNVNGAKAILTRIGISEEMFYEAIGSFAGASLRLERLGSNGKTDIFRDFAHAPSKLEATTEAVKSQYPNRKLVACMELHTFSSINRDFIPNYSNTFNKPDKAIIFYDPTVSAKKNIAPLQEAELKNAFNRQDLLIVETPEQLISLLEQQNWENANLLLMSSGNFHQLNLTALTQSVLS